MDWKSDWDRVIKRNSEALRGIIEVLFALLGLDGEDAASRIPRSLHSAVLGVLRPAESAVRRLIVIAARNVVVELAPSRPMPKGLKIRKGGGNRPPSFQLYDPRKDLPELREPRIKYMKHPPRIHFFGPDSRVDDLWPSPPPGAAPTPPYGLVKTNGLPAGSRLSSPPSTICPARPGVWPAGARGGRPCQALCSNRRSGRVRLPAIASGTFTPSMKFSPIAIGSPGMQ